MSDPLSVSGSCGFTTAPAAHPTPFDRFSDEGLIVEQMQRCSKCDDIIPISQYGIMKNGKRRKTCGKHAKSNDELDSNGRLLCTKCGSRRDLEDFPLRPDGTRSALCYRHENKRPLPAVVYDLSDWGEFLKTIEVWKDQGDLNTHTAKNTFSLESLPAFPEVQLYHDDRALTKQWFKILAAAIWEHGGYRFTLHRFYKNETGTLVGSFRCCQDMATESTKKDKTRDPSVVKRDTERMARYACHSVLNLKVSPENRMLFLTLRHMHHEVYKSKHLTPEVLNLIESYASTRTTAEIKRLLQSKKPKGYEVVTSGQIYYRWFKINEKLWKRDSDQHVSARLLLAEMSSDYSSAEFVKDNVRGLALFCKQTLTRLAPIAKELAIDSTYGTNNAGMELFAVLAEVDGAGTPLGYLFLGKTFTGGVVEQARPGAKTDVLSQFLGVFRDAGYSPSFFGCDKDPSEIAAIRRMFPGTTVQLCLWHAKRAIRMKLRSNAKTDTLKGYNPSEAILTVPELEICWGSRASSRPAGPHRDGVCLCTRRYDPPLALSSTEATSDIDKKALLELFVEHFNAHRLIPDCCGKSRLPLEIYSDSVREMYNFCYTRNWPYTWAYLFVNWYRLDQWKMWARAADMNEIPVLKTTMIVESHWRSLKHDYLHRFNRPRIDLVTWVLTMDVFPAATTRMDAILRRDSRTGRASWRKPFKSEWKKLPALDDNDSIASHYHTDYKKFVCGCKAFQSSRFLICKHLKHCFLPVNEKKLAVFSRTIERQRFFPFWKSVYLVPKSNLAEHEEGSSSGGDDDDSSDEGSHSDSDSDSDSDSGSDSDSDSDSDSEGECDTGIEADPDEEIDFDAEGVFDDESGLAEKTGLSSQVIGDRRSEVGFSSNTDDASEALGPVIAKDPRPKLRRLLSMLDEQFMSAGNVELLEAVDDHLDLSFMDEIDRTKRQRTMPKTWDPKRSRIALYYRPLSL